MKRENFSQTATSTPISNHRIYYAPAASTSGNKVKIYRHSFERMNQEYRVSMLSKVNPIDMAIAKYEWGEFILEQLPNYADDRSELFNGAKILIIRAYNIISEERYNAKIALKEATKALEDFTRHAASAMQDSNSRLSSRAIENRRANLKGEITRRRKQYADIVRRCPDQKFEHIKRRAEYCESMWY